MEIPWGVMGWSALATLGIIVIIFGIYYLVNMIIRSDNQKLNLEKRKSNKQLKQSVIINTIIWSIPLMIFVIVFMVQISYEPDEIDVNSKVIYLAQELVKDNLLSPSSAKFPWSEAEYSVVRDGNQFQVVSYVDSDNVFGASLRKVFVVIFEYHPETETYSLIDFSIE